MKKLLLLIAIAGIAMFALLGRGHKERPVAVAAPEPAATPAPATDAVPDPRVVEQLAALAVKANRNLPVMVDAQTRLDEVTTGPGAQMTYRYTLPNHASVAGSAQWIATDVRLAVTREVCVNAELRALLSAGTTLVYVYHDKDGQTINQFLVLDGSCRAIGAG